MEEEENVEAEFVEIEEDEVEEGSVAGEGDKLVRGVED